MKHVVATLRFTNVIDVVLFARFEFYASDLCLTLARDEAWSICLRTFTKVQTTNNLRAWLLLSLMATEIDQFDTYARARRQRAAAAVFLVQLLVQP